MQTRSYWSIFARAAYEIDCQSATKSLHVALARLRDNYRFPTDDEFRRGLRAYDIYGLRVCKHILDRLENAGQQERSPVHEYSIEHIMPQWIRDVPEWQEMLGDNWQNVHESWLHRLGNLTLTAYNSKYSNKPFNVKKEIEGGFNQSAVRLNYYVREQNQWTELQMKERGESLAKRALDIWPYHKADEALVQEADVRELRQRAAQRNSNSLQLDDNVRDLLRKIQTSVHRLGDIIEIVENKSVCCYGTGFFVELLPMKYYVKVILPLEFNEIQNPEGWLWVYDASNYKFVPNRVNVDCNLIVEIWQEEHISVVMPMIRQAFDRSQNAV